MLTLCTAAYGSCSTMALDMDKNGVPMYTGQLSSLMNGRREPATYFTVALATRGYMPLRQLFSEEA